MIRQETSLPHTGIATFCKAAFVPDLDRLDADVGVIGVPTDFAASMRPGCRQAPRAIRDASTRFGWLGAPAASSGYFDVNSGDFRMRGVRIADCGDVDIAFSDDSRNHARIESMVRRVLDRGAMPAILGGDHSISYPAIRAFDRFGPLTIVLFDAHLDYRDRFLGLQFTNNSPFRRARELAFVDKIISIGIRGIKSTDREFRESLEHGNRVITNYEVFDRGVEQVIDSLPAGLGNYYVSIDIDGLDPSIAPGTETPEAEGLTFRQVKQLLRGIGPRGRLVGVDLVEVNPYLDHSELTAHIAAQLLLEAIASANLGGGRGPGT